MMTTPRRAQRTLRPDCRRPTLRSQGMIISCAMADEFIVEFFHPLSGSSDLFWERTQSVDDLAQLRPGCGGDVEDVARVGFRNPR